MQATVMQRPWQCRRLHTSLFSFKQYAQPLGRKGLPVPELSTLQGSPMAQLLRIPFSTFFFTLTWILALAVEDAPPIGFLLSETTVKKPTTDEKLTHLRFYWHDVLSQQPPTAIRVAEAASSNASASNFGVVVMFDDPMTAGPELTSRLVGRAQGFYAFASQEEYALLMSMNLAFVDGKYNGSTITVLGRNPFLSSVREMSVVGGSGLFRLVRGYVQAKTYSFDTKTGDTVVEYNVFVSHQ